MCHDTIDFDVIEIQSQPDYEVLKENKHLYYICVKLRRVTALQGPHYRFPRAQVFGGEHN